MAQADIYSIPQPFETRNHCGAVNVLPFPNRLSWRAQLRTLSMGETVPIVIEGRKLRAHVRPGSPWSLMHYRVFERIEAGRERRPGRVLSMGSYGGEPAMRMSFDADWIGPRDIAFIVTSKIKGQIEIGRDLLDGDTVNAGAPKPLIIAKVGNRGIEGAVDREPCTAVSPYVAAQLRSTGQTFWFPEEAQCAREYLLPLVAPVARILRVVCWPALKQPIVFGRDALPPLSLAGGTATC